MTPRTRELPKFLQRLLQVLDAVFLLLDATHLVLVHGTDPVVLAVEAVELGMEAVNFIPGFLHILVVIVLQHEDALAVSFLKVGYCHVAHCARGLVQVAQNGVLGQALVDNNRGNHD